LKVCLIQILRSSNLVDINTINVRSIVKKNPSTASTDKLEIVSTLWVSGVAILCSNESPNCPRRTIEQIYAGNAIDWTYGIDHASVIGKHIRHDIRNTSWLAQFRRQGQNAKPTAWADVNLDLARSDGSAK